MVIEDQSGVGHAFFAKNDIAQVYREASGVVVLRFREGARLDLANTTEVTDLHIQAANHGKRPTLADVRGMRSVAQPARALVTGPTLEAVILRLAILVGNPVTRVLANFFSRVGALEYPVQIFDEEAAARRWLSEENT